DVPGRALFDPSLWLVAHLPPSVAQIVAMTFYAAELAVAIVWLAIRLGLEPLPTVAASWIGLLLAFPYVYPTLGFDFLWGGPNYVPLTLQNTAIILVFLDLGRGPRAADVARFGAIAAIGTYQVIQYSIFAPMSVVMLVFFGVVAVFAATSPMERLIKLAAVTVLAAFSHFLFSAMLMCLLGFATTSLFFCEC